MDGGSTASSRRPARALAAGPPAASRRLMLTTGPALLGRNGDRGKVRPVRLAALENRDVTEGRRGRLQRIQQVPEHRQVHFHLGSLPPALHEVVFFMERHVGDMGDAGDLAEHLQTLVPIRQIDGDRAGSDRHRGPASRQRNDIPASQRREVPHGCGAGYAGGARDQDPVHAHITPRRIRSRASADCGGRLPLTACRSRRARIPPRRPVPIRSSGARRHRAGRVLTRTQRERRSPPER